MTVGMPVQSSSSLALRPAHGRLPKKHTYKNGPDDLQVCYNLLFYSTFEVLVLPIKGPMEDAGVVKLHHCLYEPSPTPCLYVAPASVQNMVGRVPLIP